MCITQTSQNLRREIELFNLFLKKMSSVGIKTKIFLNNFASQNNFPWGFPLNILLHGQDK
jgi:hypothetical protein